MGIDGIGKPPGSTLGGVSGISGSEPPRAAEPFAVGQSAPPAIAGATPVSAALSSLQRGELSLDQYLDGRVSEATSHLAGKLSPEQFDFVRQSLREQLATDPVLVELVQRATGSASASELR